MKDTSPAAPAWKDLLESWKREQEELRSRMRMEALSPLPRYVAGVDAAFSPDRKTVYAVAVIYDRQQQEIIETAHAIQPVTVPYIPGFLSFREGPVVVEALRNLRRPFDVVCFDGQGYAHPRRCGLATHVSVTLDCPGIGVAKSRLIGTFGEPDSAAGSFSPLLHRDEEIGLVLRTKDHTCPVYVSIGHRVDLPAARELVLTCCTRYRIPEPTRQADIEVGKLKRNLAESNEVS